MFKTFLLKEMPEIYDDTYLADHELDDDLDTPDTKKDFDHIKTIKYGNMQIHIYQTIHNNQVEYEFMESGKTVAEYGGDIRKHYLETENIWQRKDPQYRGLMRFIFAEYLIPTYKVIVSDSRLSSLGFAFWQKFYQEYSNKFDIGVYDIESGKEIKIGSAEELKKYYGQGKGRLRFLMTL